MKRAAAIVTNRGGRTCHAAIIARELGIPAVVGCGDATETIQRRPAGHGVVRRRRHRLRLRRRSCDFDADADRARRAAADPGQDHDERRQSRPRVRLRRHSEPGRRPRAARVHHQPHDRRASARAARVRPARRRICSDTIRRQMAGYADPVAFYVDKLCEGIAHDRRGVRAGAGDRAPVGLQVERIREPDRRAPVRAARGEPDARVPRRLALRRRSVPALLRARVPRARSACATRWGSRTCRSWCRSCARSKEAEQVVELLAANGLEARRERAQDHHDVRAADQCAARRAVPRVLRRHVDRLERHDAAHARPRSRLRDHRARCSTSATTRSRRCSRWRSRPAARRASTSASAARGRRIIRTSRAGWSSRASRACR